MGRDTVWRLNIVRIVSPCMRICRFFRFYCWLIIEQRPRTCCNIACLNSNCNAICWVFVIKFIYAEQRLPCFCKKYVEKTWATSANKANRQIWQTTTSAKCEKMCADWYCRYTSSWCEYNIQAIAIICMHVSSFKRPSASYCPRIVWIN